MEEMEAKDLGADPNDKRACTKAEFTKILEISRREHLDFDRRIRCPAVTLWAHHLIHRANDTGSFKVSAPPDCVQWPFALKTKTCWSKNVKKMKHCPDQMLLGSDDSKTCVLLWLSAHLEAHPQECLGAECLWTNARGKKAPRNVKKNCVSNVSEIWEMDEFAALEDQTGDEADKGLGVHSERKRGANESKCLGALTRQTECPGCWLGDEGQRIVSQVHQSPGASLQWWPCQTRVQGKLCHA